MEAPADKRLLTIFSWLMPCSFSFGFAVPTSTPKTSRIKESIIIIEKKRKERERSAFFSLWKGSLASFFGDVVVECLSSSTPLHALLSTCLSFEGAKQGIAHKHTYLEITNTRMELEVIECRRVEEYRIRRRKEEERISDDER